ncbi:phage protein, HK97 gp10 family [Clostridium acidisoli DSM 12555]|uniref:Phage protein, HK97 gp10 family n=1 Tax=Clostridium acidisoli DSM 12555 TaxID=1121291 RepID=A0A1W1X6G6_9CLOT|nr:HK97-gp10 family putative phage morphogenesis protein [Clostridium acidisoli]SMC19318.1 phage protein, HK97 gp10 family [Clostridium acidisoli DSM 12555]
MNTIEVTGLDSLMNDFIEMTITTADEKRVMKNAIEPAYTEIEKNAPTKTEKLKKNIKQTVKKVDFATVGEIKLNQWYSMFTEYGTSQSKEHIGWFERSVDNSMVEVMAKMAEGLFEKAI